MQANRYLTIMKIILTPQESEEYFYNALCNGLGYIQGYGLYIVPKKSEYEQAKLSLETLKPNESICYEDILMQILRGGGQLNLYDEEGEEHNIITLKDVHERVSNTEFSHLVDMIEERDDAVTSDVILQTTFLGEVIYG